MTHRRQPHGTTGGRQRRRDRCRHHGLRDRPGRCDGRPSRAAARRQCGGTDRGMGQLRAASTGWSSAAGSSRRSERPGWPGSIQHADRELARTGNAGNRGHRRESGRQGGGARPDGSLGRRRRHHRHQHLVAVGDRDRRRACAARAGRRHALLQPGAGAAAGGGGQRPRHRARVGRRPSSRPRRPGARSPVALPLDAGLHRQPRGAAVLRRGAAPAAGEGARRRPPSTP